MVDFVAHVAYVSSFMILRGFLHGVHIRAHLRMRISFRIARDAIFSPFLYLSAPCAFRPDSLGFLCPPKAWRLLSVPAIAGPSGPTSSLSVPFWLFWVPLVFLYVATYELMVPPEVCWSSKSPVAFSDFICEGLFPDY